MTLTTSIDKLLSVHNKNSVYYTQKNNTYTNYIIFA